MNKMNEINEIKKILRLIKSFGYAGRGIKKCVLGETNFRIHIVAAVTVLIFSLMYGVTAAQGVYLALTVTLVVSLEAINTAIEAAVDLCGERSPLAALAKDAAAGAVLIAAIGAVIVAIFTFSDTARLAAVFGRILCSQNIIYTVLYIFWTAVFVFGINNRKL